MTPTSPSIDLHIDNVLLSEISAVQPTPQSAGRQHLPGHRVLAHLSSATQGLAEQLFELDYAQFWKAIHKS
jgi:hypothetical protein